MRARLVTGTAAPPSVLSLDPANERRADLETVTGQFVETTGLCVSLYDQRGRRLGPVVGTGFGRLLAESSLWTPRGPGTELEQSLVAKCFETGSREAAYFEGALRVEAMPMDVGGKPLGIVYGWAFGSFPVALECMSIARTVDVSSQRLWNAARRLQPVNTRRMKMYAGLLETLIGSTVRQQEAIERLHELGRLREAFLARVSHDLRTPLHALSLRLELLLAGKLDDRVKLLDTLKAMRRNVDQESRLVEDLLDVARTMTGTLEVRREPLNLDSVLVQAVSDMQPSAIDKGITLDFAPPDRASMQISGDAHRLHQVFGNLLTNAVKFTSRAGKIRVSARATSECIQVDVSDTGRGMEAADAARIFEPFEKANQDNAQGLGLGLTISRQVIEEHGGAIWVAETAPQQGTTIRVRLPRSASHEGVRKTVTL